MTFLRNFPESLPGIDTPIAGGTAGSVLFVNSDAALGQDNDNFFWDATNKYLGLGTKAPSARLTVEVDDIKTTQTAGILLTNTTAAVVAPGATRQFTPGIQFHGSAWDTDGSLFTSDWLLDANPVSAGAPYGKISFSHSTDGGTTYSVIPFYLDSSGSVFAIGAYRSSHTTSAGLVATGTNSPLTLKGNRAVDSASADIVLTSTLDRNAGLPIVQIADNGGSTRLLDFTSSGGIVFPSTSAATGIVLYNTADETTNTESLKIYWGAGVAAYVETAAAGSGSNRNLYVRASNVLNLGGGGGARWAINAANLYPLAATYDLGAIANTVRAGYFNRTIDITQTAVETVDNTTQALNVVGAAHTNMKASTEVNFAKFNFGQKYSWQTGAITEQSAFKIIAPSYAFDGASTVTRASTFTVTGAPTQDANATLTNSYVAMFQQAAVATAQTNGVVIENTTAAADGAQQYSPLLIVRGQGFASDTSASMPVEWAIQAQAVQGTSAPSTQLRFFSRVNNGTAGAWDSRGYMSSAGSLYWGGSVGSGSGSFFCSTTNTTGYLKGKRDAGDAGADIILTGQATRTAGVLVQIENSASGTSLWNVGYYGNVAHDPADVSINAPAALTGVLFDQSTSVITDKSTAGGGTNSNLVSFNSYQAPTLAALNNPVTTTTATTLYVAGPTAGTNMTITNPHAAVLTVEDAATNTVLYPLVVKRTTSGTAATNIGTGIRIQAENDAGASVDCAAIQAVLTTVTSGAEVGALSFCTRTAGGALQSRWSISGAGTLYPNSVFNIGSTSGRVSSIFIGRTVDITQTAVETVDNQTQALNVVGAAHASIKASTEVNFAKFNFGQKYSWQTGDITEQSAFKIIAPSIAFDGASTVTRASTFTVVGAPTADTNATLTDSYVAMFQTAANTNAFTIGYYGNVAETPAAPTLASAPTAGIGILHSHAGVAYKDSFTVDSGTFGDAFAFHSWAVSTISADDQATGITYTYAATVYIAGAPAAGTKAAITNAYALWIDGGLFRYDGTTQSTVGAAGGASALPATPTGYLPIDIGGTSYVVPYYAKA